ncbi:SGNH/GDSL hydrolase family protein [Clostridium oryzae]|uniref:GDSL-like lipase/acylhydrolase n=1 Tax=Clostridium oryzae TaxID=1450648 RepID=A0A1V4IW54_9CLOT|nr:GDSL-type esterase/lipase family protein [Clostridium oryzae]OPJ64129.1 GDSL-like lipase/acylhydrolase [Clostridium oryzae]
MEKKTVYVIGDSVSLHYSPYLEKMIKGKYNYKRLGNNAGDSKRILQYLKDAYDEEIHWDIMLINSGLHDIRVDRITLRKQIENWEYRDNLRAICELALKMSEKVAWVNITPVSDTMYNMVGGFLRYNEDVVEFNDIAEKIMREYKIPYIDIFSFTKSLGEDIYSDQAHFKDDVRALQGAFIAGYLYNQ